MKYLLLHYKENNGLGKKKSREKCSQNTKIRTVKNCIENCFQVDISEPKWHEFSDVTSNHRLLLGAPGAAECSVCV